jgi:hypothetical protein
VDVSAVSDQITRVAASAPSEPGPVYRPVVSRIPGSAARVRLAKDGARAEDSDGQVTSDQNGEQDISAHHGLAPLVKRGLGAVLIQQRRR